MLLTACGQLSVPAVPPLPGLDSFAGPGVPHRALAPRRRPGRQARRRHRHRLQRDPGRAGDPADRAEPSTSTSARPAGRSRRWTTPTASAPSACSSASRSCSALDRAAVFGFMELGAAAMTNRRWLLRAVPRARRGGRSRGRSRTPSCARKVTPTDEVGCKRIMLTDEWYPTLTEAQRRAGDRPDRRGHADGRAHRRRHRARRPTCSSSRPGFRTHGFVAPMEVTGAGGRTLAEEWAPTPRAYLGMSVPGLPEHVPALRAEHERRHRLGHLHDRGGRQPRDRRAARARAGARAADRGRRRAPRRRSTASCAPRWRHRSGTRAARAGTWTRTATTRTSGPGCGRPTASGPRRSSPASTSSRRDRAAPDHAPDQPLLREGPLGTRARGDPLPRGTPHPGDPHVLRQARRRRDHGAGARDAGADPGRVRGHPALGRRAHARRAAAVSRTTRRSAPRSSGSRGGSTPSSGRRGGG